MVNQIINQPKTDQRWKAIISLIVGILSMIPIIYLFTHTSSSMGIRLTYLFKEKTVLLSFLSILGIILGIKGLKSTKKNFAIAGIVFSIIGLLGLIIILYGAFAFSFLAW